MPFSRRAPALAAALTLSPAVASAQEPPPSASFAQLAGEAGCVVPANAAAERGGCAGVRALQAVGGVAVSPDDRHVYVTAGGSVDAVLAFARDADTGALEFTGCISETGGDGRVGTDGACEDGHALGDPTGLLASPDGRFLYVLSAGSHAITWYARDADTGALTPAGCLTLYPRGPACGWAGALHGPTSLAISPEGTNLYVTAAGDGSVSVFSRSVETGSLEPAGCLSETGLQGLCENGSALEGAADVTLGGDGGDVYVAATSGALTAFRRDADGGALTQSGCLHDAPVDGGTCVQTPGLAGAADAALTPDGSQLLVAAAGDQAISVFDRGAADGTLAHVGCAVQREEEPAEEEDEEEEEEEFEDDEDLEDAAAAALPAGLCTEMPALGAPSRLVLSPDGLGVFALGTGTLAALTRDAESGALSWFACAAAGEGEGDCTATRGPSYLSAVAPAADGRTLYVAGGDGVAVLTASTAITGAAPVAGATRVRVRLACPAARAAGCRGRLALGARAGRAFSIRRGGRDAIALRLPARARRGLERRGRARVALIARDARGQARSTVRRVTLRR